MKITATPKVSYMVKIGEIEFKADVVSEWEGLTKLDTEHGTMIVAGLKPRPGMQGAFDEIFRDWLDGGAYQLTVHMASPKIIEGIKDAEKAERITAEFHGAVDAKSEKPADIGGTQP